MRETTIKGSLLNSLRGIANSLPILFGVILLIGILSNLLTKDIYANIFTGNLLFDPLIGSVIGSISAGAPFISYIFGGEMLSQGVSLVAVTAFIISWVSVGVITLPVEAHFLGKRFSIIRNLLSFVFSIIVAIVTVLILQII
ncbi:hypothetical protein ACFLZZ_01220 [Nanoarchaeota archaeon]